MGIIGSFLRMGGQARRLTFDDSFEAAGLDADGRFIFFLHSGREPDAVEGPRRGRGA